MEHQDVDDYGILDLPSPDPDLALPEAVLGQPESTHDDDGQEPDPTCSPDPASVAEMAVEQPLISVQGNRNDTAMRDLHKTVFGIENAYFRAEITQLARPLPEKRSGRGFQDPDALLQLAERYVPPPGLLGQSSAGEPATAFEILSSRRVLLLTAAARDGGQFAAGLRLGHELRDDHPDLVVREELIDRLDADELLVAHEPAVVIGDLRDAHNRLEAVRRGLVEFVNQLKPHQSYLILIIPIDHARRFEEFLPDRVHHLLRPEPVEVFRRHIIRGDVESLVRAPEFADRLHDLWPPEVKELADAVSDRIGHGDELERALREVLHGREDGQGPPLREVVRAKQERGDVEWLALLLAATLLEGASPWHIVDAADRLLALNGVTPKEIAPLLLPSPYTRLLALDHGSFDFDTCEFQPPGSGTRVLRYFWREHRDLRKALQNWIGELPRQIADLTREELERLADRCAELASEDGAAVALELAEEWAATRRGAASEGDLTSDHWTAQYRRSIAVRLLTTTATDPAVGTRIRQKLLDWSKAANSDLQLLTAEVCGGIGESFPRVALTRLKHLANSENQHVRNAVLVATRQIGIDLGASSFLRYVSEWFDKAGPGRLALLAESVADVLVNAKDVDLETASAFWQQALDMMPPESLRPVVASWLRVAAGAMTDRRNSMVEILVLATGSEPQRIARMHYASRFTPKYQEAAQSDLTATLHRLSIRLDEVDPVWQR